MVEGQIVTPTMCLTLSRSNEVIIYLIEFICISILTEKEWTQMIAFAECTISDESVEHEGWLQSLKWTLSCHVL